MSPDNNGPNSGPDSFSKVIEENKIPIFGLLIGLVLIGSALLLYKADYFTSANKIEVLGSKQISNSETQVSSKEIVVEIVGAVISPGVYKLKEGDRVEDLLIAGGGLSGDADREWVNKYINKAAKLVDGQKIYIYKIGETPDNQIDGSSAKSSGGIKVDQGVVAGQRAGGVNINAASLSELDSLPGIGPVYGQSIIDHRPYSSVEELVSKGVIKQTVFDKIKSDISVY